MLVFLAQEHTQECNGIVFRSFDAVTVRLSLDTSNVQHEKLVLQMVQPFIEGFSVPSLAAEATVVEDVPMPKSKPAGKNKASKRSHNK